MDADRQTAIATIVNAFRAAPTSTTDDVAAAPNEQDDTLLGQFEWRTAWRPLRRQGRWLRVTAG
jgi:hypothetical protein